jgi:sialic acid synthase SpsE
MEHRANMKEVCNQIAEIKRVITETKKQLTKEEREAVRIYRHSMLQRIQAVNEKHLEKEGIYVPRIRFTSDVFKKCNEISNKFEHDAKGRFIFP